MQFQVPQFIETEDKIIGPLSFKQFGFLAAAGLTSFLLFFVVESWLWFILSLILVSAGVGFAFIKVNGKPLHELIAAAAVHFWRPQQYIWQPTGAVITSRTAETVGAGRFSLEKILAGQALKNAWRSIQVGTTQNKKGSTRKLPVSEQYMAFTKLSGERRAAKRVDYR